MKSPVEVILRTVHVGAARRVVTLGIHGKGQSRDIRLAHSLKAEYFRAKTLPDTILRLIEP